MNATDATRKAVSEINVTPLIDVLLVLLIIFMVIVPATPKGLEALVPQPPKTATPAAADRAIVVSVRGGEGGALSYLINQDAFGKPELEAKLQQIFPARRDKIMFVRGDSGLNYSTVAEVIDMGAAAGVTNIGIITPTVEQGD